MEAGKAQYLARVVRANTFVYGNLFFENSLQFL